MCGDGANDCGVSVLTPYKAHWIINVAQTSSECTRCITLHGVSKMCNVFGL